MLSWLVDIPLPAFNLDGMKWTVSGIILLSLFYTYAIFQLTSPLLSPRRDIPEIPYLARAKQLQAARKAQRELEEKQKWIVQSGSFRFLDLPPEITFAVLANCTDWPGMYLSLVLVSRHCQTLAFHAFLPHTPIRLIIPEQIHSFGSLLRKKPKLATLVHHLWVTPYKEDLLGPCVDIVKKCRNLKSFASNAYVVQESVISTSTGKWASFLETRNGLALFRQLTHLRLIGDRFPTDIPLPNLTHLSYGSDTADINVHIGMTMIEDPVACPSLQTVIVTKLRASGGLRISRATHSRFFAVELPPKRTELELWCDNVSRRGLWALCQSSKE